MNLSVIGKDIYIFIMNRTDDCVSKTNSHIIYSPWAEHGLSKTIFQYINFIFRIIKNIFMTKCW